MEPRTERGSWGFALLHGQHPHNALLPHFEPLPQRKERTSRQAPWGTNLGLGAALPEPSLSPRGEASALQSRVPCPRGSPQPAVGHPVPPRI